MTEPEDKRELPPGSFEQAKTETDEAFSNIGKFFAPGFGRPLTGDDLLKMMIAADQKEVAGIVPTIIDDKHYAAIGKVAANWAALEMLINSAIWQIGEIPDHIGACITSQLYTFDARMKALIALLGVRGGFENSQTSEQIP